MGFTIVFTARGVRETERPVSFIPKGALTHHPQAGGGTACGSRALSEGNFAFCGKRQTTPQHFPGAAALSVQACLYRRVCTGDRYGTNRTAPLSTPI